MNDKKPIESFWKQSAFSLIRIKIRNGQAYTLQSIEIGGVLIFIQKAIIILIGSLLVGIGVNFFLVPFELLDGGALGISLIFHYVADVRVGFALLLINIPIFFAAWFFYRSFFYNGIHGLLFSSLMIDLLYPLHIFGEAVGTAPLLSAIFGGVFIGAGVGIMLRRDISVGGTDLLAQMLAKRLKLNPGYVIFSFDILIVTIGSILISSTQLFVSFTTVFFVGITISLLVSTSKRRHTISFDKASDRYA
ncbi:YitT family protein [Sporosarcina koreensis]|uniref:YitT family protein n=1 Tax=Sporosarcina koreensis TaxID=334735 RepID=A0ABW0TZM4_9BACL